MALATGIITVQDLLDSLGGIPPWRVTWKSPFGTATEADLIAFNRQRKAVFELVDGMLVEKPSGSRESMLAVSLGASIRSFVKANKLGFVTGATGLLRLAPGLARSSDVAFMDWRCVPGSRIPSEPVADLSPDLAVEILRAGNTEAEMERKLREYFETGTTFVWLVDPRTRTITIHDRDEFEPRIHAGSEPIVLNKVLPGFRITPAELFNELDEQGPPNED